MIANVGLESQDRFREYLDNCLMDRSHLREQSTDSRNAASYRFAAEFLEAFGRSGAVLFRCVERLSERVWYKTESEIPINPKHLVSPLLKYDCSPASALSNKHR